MLPLRLRDARLVPWIAGPALALLGVNEAWFDEEFRRSFGVVVLLAGWIGATFLVAAFRPSLGAVAVATFYPVGQALEVPGPGGTGLIALLVACSYAGYADPPSLSRWGVGAAIAVFVGTTLATGGIVWDSVFFPAIFLPAWWTGLLVRREQERSAQLAELAAELDAQREAVARAAAAAERAHIAREVHDAVAHSVSVMTLHVGGLRRQLEDVLAERPAEREVMLGIERLGRESVEELRTLVGILREPVHDAPAAPTPSLSRIADLVADVRTAGLPVELEVVGEPFALPRALDVSAYRVLQEALSNVLRHAGASRTRVVLRYCPDAVELDVEDGGAADRLLVPSQPASRSAGHGLLGMRERVAVHGGRLQTGVRSDGGFSVRARFPLSHRFAGSRA